MGTFVETYRDYDIWVSEEDEFVPGIVYYAVGGPCPVTGYWKTKKGAKNNIDKAYSKTKQYVETYNGVNIYFQKYRMGLCNLYSATVGAATKYFDNYRLDDCKAWIDKQLEPPPPPPPPPPGARNLIVYREGDPATDDIPATGDTRSAILIQKKYGYLLAPLTGDEIPGTTYPNDHLIIIGGYAANPFSAHFFPDEDPCVMDPPWVIASMTRDNGTILTLIAGCEEKDTYNAAKTFTKTTPSWLIYLPFVFLAIAYVAAKKKLLPMLPGRG